MKAFCCVCVGLVSARDQACILSVQLKFTEPLLRQRCYHSLVYILLHISNSIFRM